MKRISTLAVAGLLLLGLCTSARADTVTLSLVASYAKTNPFGLAFDGTNLWWKESSGPAHEMTTSGVDTGTVTPTAYVSALAWDGSHLVEASGSTLRFITPVTGALDHTLTLDSIGGSSLIDGLDFDHGQVWHSPDVSVVYRRDGTTGAVITPDPWLSAAGGFSGVERVDIGANTYILLVNDASSPRKLDVRLLDGTLLGQAEFANQRYEDLAFDGRYLWAADFYGDKIDKIDILVNGTPIFSSVPLPAAFPLGLGLLGLLGVGTLCRRLRRQPVV